MATATLTLGSQNRWLADGSTTIWNFNFVGGYLASDTVLAYSFLTDEAVRTDHILEFISAFQVRITPAVADGRTLVIYRDSSNGGLPRADFTDGGGITESNLDLMAKQSVFVSEEVRDFIGITTEADLASALLTTSNNASAAAISAASANVSEDIATVAAASSQAYAALASTHRTAAEIAAANAAGVVATHIATQAGTGSGQGADTVGASSATDYTDNTLGFLVVKNTSNGYNALRGFTKAEQALIQAGTSVSDHAAVLDAMLVSEKHLYLPRGTFRRSTKWGVTDRQKISGAGMGTALIDVIGDVVGLELTGEYCDLSDFGILSSGAHTQNGINIGTAAGARCDRGSLRNIAIQAMGNDGLVLYAGNLGTLSSIRSRQNGRDGVNFNRAASADNHAWTIAGYLDCIQNTRDGFHIEDGTSASDAFASKCHSGGLVVCQSNGRYGVHIGSRANIFTIYSEANATEQIYLSTQAFSNSLTSVEGIFAGPGFTTIANGNRCDNHNAVGDYQRVYLSKVQFGGGTGVGLRIKDTDGTAGYIDVEKTAVREIRTKYGGSSGAWNAYHEHSVPGTEVLQSFMGRLVPSASATWDQGTASLRWNVGYYQNMRVYGAPTGVANSLTLGYQVSATATAGASTLPATPAGFIAVYVGATLQKIPYYNA